MLNKNNNLTIKDIAKLAGVSTATVSRAMNGKFDVNKATRKRIEQICSDYGYRPSPIARGLSLKQSFTIAVVIPDIGNLFYPEVIRGIEEVMDEHGYSIIYINTDFKPNKEQEALRRLRDGEIDKAIMSLSNHSVDECRALVNMGHPIVLVGNELENVECVSVSCNNFASAYTATEYLIKMGHTKIAHMCGSRDSKTGVLRLQGYTEALNNYGIPVNPDWLIATQYFEEDAYNSMRKLLLGENIPTAIFAANDIMAVGCYNAIYEAGLRIPDDISVVGHDDIKIASLIYPPLTTMQQQKREIGRMAARKLLLLEDNTNVRDINILPTTLVERKSVKKI